jgi:hypothetical protein
VPSVNLETADAAELAGLLQFLAGWLTSDPARSPPHSRHTTVIPPTALTSSAAIWTALPSCSAATTANRSSSLTPERSSWQNTLRQPGCGERRPARLGRRTQR